MHTESVLYYGAFPEANSPVFYLSAKQIDQPKLAEQTGKPTTQSFSSFGCGLNRKSFVLPDGSSNQNNFYQMAAINFALLSLQLWAMVRESGNFMRSNFSAQPKKKM